MIWAIALGGAAGTVARYGISQLMQRHSTDFPYGTFVINVVGSFLIGLLARALSGGETNPALRAALTIGFCGGFTTFSTFSAEFVSLVQQGRGVRAAFYVVLSVTVGIIATFAGIAVGARITSSRG